jgi:hypothetical protein
MSMPTGFGQNGNNFRLLESDTVSILRQVFGGGNVEILRFASNARTAAKLEKFSVLAYPSSFGQKLRISKHLGIFRNLRDMPSTPPTRWLAATWPPRHAEVRGYAGT